MLIYRSLMTLVAPLLVGLFVFRWVRGQETAADLRERLGLGARSPENQLWVHGASNGELNSARPLLESLRESRPDLAILVTANTVTGRNMVRDWGIGGVSAVLAPLDLRPTTARFLSAHSIIAMISLENELWPNRIVMCAAQNRPVALVAARLSRKSARVWRRLPSLRRPMLAALTLLAPQDKGSRNRFVTLGVAPAKIAPLVDLKALYRPAPDSDTDTAPAIGFDRAATWLAASTHPGEEEVILAAHIRVLETRPDARLIIAPRHPRRAPEIAGLIGDRSLSYIQRSLGGKISGQTQVYLADTMGEMPLWYRSAAVTFVGGSLVDKGGHTPFEPAAYGTALVHGPYLSNFRAIYRRLDAADAALWVRDSKTLAATVLDVMADPAPMAARARQVTRDAADLDAVMHRILAILPPVQ